jgi:cytochrome c-type biogenesis protein CcmH
MLWFTITLMMAAAVAIASWPFLRRTRTIQGASSDIYRSQLTELEREESAGLISADDARMARTEIQRRLISAAGPAAASEEASMTLTDRTTFIAIAASVAIGSAIIYSFVGTPGASSPTTGFAELQQTPGAMLAASGDAAQPGQISVAPVDEMIGSLETRLASQPDDVEGWRMLGWSKFRTDDFAGAAVAYGRALKLAPGDSETQSSYGESLARAAGGMVTPEATQALQAALKANPQDPRARFLLGLKKEQEGKPGEALNDWLAMLKSAAPDAAWYDEVHGRVLELSQSAGIDVTARLPKARTVIAEPTPDRPAGPSASQVSEAQAMDPASRQAMIDGMVSRLDAKLKANPKDADGWARLIRARRVLGQTDLAQKALADGRSHFAGNAAATQQLQAAMNDPLDLPPT